MAASLRASLSGLTLSTSGRPAALHQGLHRPFTGSRLSVSTHRQTESSRGGLVIVAAQNAKKRIRQGERNRQYNKSHKSAVATRIKKVLKTLDGFKEVQAEEELAPVQKLLTEAYQEIDKAVVKGILHKNTAARRKSRLALARQRVLIASGLYKPVSA